MYPSLELGGSSRREGLVRKTFDGISLLFVGEKKRAMGLESEDEASFVYLYRDLGTGLCCLQCRSCSRAGRSSLPRFSPSNDAA